MNTLWFGDNLHVMRQHLNDESVDLIYLDPPFNSQADYNVVFTAPSGRGHRAQIQAFEDTWHWGEESEEALATILGGGGATASMVRALRSALGTTDMMAYIVMMTVRLIEMRRLLKSTGSLVLHCDPTASHYLRIILDCVFDARNFVAEIVWKRTNARSTKGRWPRLHDRLLHYCKGPGFFFKDVQVPADKQKLPHTLITGLDGQKYQTFELTAPGMRNGPSGQPWRGFDPAKMNRHWANEPGQLDLWHQGGEIHLPKKGGFPRRIASTPFDAESRQVTVGDVWTDIDRINQTAKERIGYPTQKPLALLERVILAASREGDTVLDPFCGCGTTIEAAQKLGRSWVGIDITHVAIQVIADRLNRWAPHAKFKIEGQPVDLAGAAKLAEIDKYQFQWWATWLCGGQPHGGERKGRDQGIDGTLEFVSRRGEHDWGVISVKGGRSVGPAAIRDLHGTIEREGAPIGVLISLTEPTREMEREAVSAGFVDLGGQSYRKLQIRTIEQLFAGHAIDCPFLLTTVQGAPGRAKGPRRVAIAPEELIKQRTLLLPITGGKDKVAPATDLFGQVPARVERRRRA